MEILNGSSEDVFPILLPRIKADVNVWLDSISRNLVQFGKVCVLVDDICCFNPRLPEYATTYPSLDTLLA